MRRFDDTPVGGDQDGNRYLVRAGKSLEANKARGALLGLAVGDALGTTLEFQTPAPQPFAPPLTGPHQDIIGGGPFSVAAGQVTDDTQMACVLARSLMEKGGLKPDHVGAGYIAWAQHAFDIGQLTRTALSRIASGVSADVAGKEVWEETGRQSAGNGSLMRTIPIALFYEPLAKRRREVSMADAAITHFDPRCQLACAAYNGAVAHAVRGPQKTSQQMLDAAREDLDLAEASLLDLYPAEAQYIQDAAVMLRADLDAAAAPDPDLYGTELHLVKMQGYVRVAFRLAFWQLVHAASFEAGLIDTVNRGGDADTNGAIVGGLLGAKFGADAIPAQWASAVMTSLADDSGVWGTTYHPRRLMELLPW